MNLLYPIIAVLSAFISFLTLTPPVQNINNEYKTTLGAALPQGVAVFETSLQSAITNTADTMTLVSNSVRGGSSLSGYNCFTIDEGRADAEFACGTVSGTTVSGLKRGIDPLSGTSTNATLQFAHRRGASVKVTDFPLIQVMRNQLSGNERFDNLLLYSTTSEVCGPGSATGTICGKQYIDGVAVAGASDADDTTKGIVEMATVSEASSTASLGGTGARLAIGSNLVSGTPGVSLIPMTQSTGKLLPNWLDLSGSWTFAGAVSFTATTTFTGPTLGIGQFVQLVASTTITGQATPQPVYVATTTNALNLSDANVNMDSQFLGFAVSGASNGATTTVQMSGIVRGFTGLTRGSLYYISDTAGSISSTAGTNEIRVGYAISPTEIMIDRDTSTWVYVGSGTCSIGTFGAVTQANCDIVGPTIARYAVVALDVSNTNGCDGGRDGAARNSFVVAKNGATSVNASAATECQTSGGGPLTQPMFTAAFTSTSSIRITGRDLGATGAEWTGTQTAYFYR
jgi:hypothetical protein